MKIVALWDRRKVAPESRMIFALTDDGKFLEIEPETKYIGNDARGKSIYEDTGLPEYGDAFMGNVFWEFDKVNYFMRQFGGELIADFRG